MTASDDITNQHDISEIDENKVDPSLTPEDEDDKFIEGEIGDLDELHVKAFGDTNNLPIDKEVNKDEIKRVKDLTKKQQKSSK